MGKESSALGKRDTGRSRKLPFENGCPHFDLEGAGAAALTLCPRNNQGLSQLDPNRPPRRDPRLLPPSLLAATPGRRATGTPLPKFNTPFTLWRLSLRFLPEEKAERTTDLPEVRRHDAACLDCSEYQDRDRHTFECPACKTDFDILLVREPLQ